MTTIPILRHQIKFINSKEVHTGLVAGYGSGKSIAGVIKTITKLMRYPGVNVAYYLPTYPLIRDIAYGNFSTYLKLFGVDFELNKSDKEFTTDFGVIKMRSMDNPQLIVGYEVGYSLIDEADILTKEKMQDAYIRIIGRNRKPLWDGSANSTDIVSTPDGFKWMYDYFVKQGKGYLIRARTEDNPYLPKSYIADLKDTYSDQQLAAYMNGEFVNLTSGSVVNSFDRNIHKTEKIAGNELILHIGVDFNVTNMSAVVHIKENGISYAVDEFTEIYDTNALIDAIKYRYPKNYIYIYPDASGQARKTVGADVTDIRLLQKAGFKIKVGKSNPRVKERVNEINRMLRNGKYFVNLSKCKNYVDALEQLSYKGGVPDKASGLDHIFDAGTYYVVRQSNKIVSMR